MKFLQYYLLLINAAAFCLMLADKLRAKKKAWRISEQVLLGAAVIGGSLGVLLGMYVGRHKTRKSKFSIGVPVVFSVQSVSVILIFCI